MFKGLEFYAPYESPLSAGEVKDEMWKQLDISPSQMILIFNGQILKDETNLETLGVSHGSMLFLYVKGYENFLLQSPKRLINEIFSLVSNLSTVPDGMLIDAIKSIKTIMSNPTVIAFTKILQELQEIFNDIRNYIDEIQCTCNDSIICSISAIEDRTFLNSNFYDIDNNNRSVKNEYSVCSIYETKHQLIYDPYEEDEEIDNIQVEVEDPINLNYMPCISTEPLPYKGRF